MSIVVTHVQASFSTEVEDFLTKLQAVVNDLIDHCAAKAQEIFTGLADGIDAVVAGKLFDPTKNERQAAEYRQLMKKSGWLSKDQRGVGLSVRVRGGTRQAQRQLRRQHGGRSFPSTSRRFARLRRRCARWRRWWSPRSTN